MSLFAQVYSRLLSGTQAQDHAASSWAGPQQNPLHTETRRLGEPALEPCRAATRNYEFRQSSDANGPLLRWFYESEVRVEGEYIYY